MKIAVAGGSGTVGAYVVEAARAQGDDVVVISRTQGVDVFTGEGLTSALQGVDAVIDVLNISTLSARKAKHFFETTTHHLLAAEEQAGVKHHVALSIVGIDGVEASYYAGKLAQERAIEAGKIPYTIARTAQFHEFAGQILAGQKGPVAVMPKAQIQPVSTREVAEHLVHVAHSDPAGRAIDLVGPQEENLADLARRQLEADGVSRKVLETRFLGVYGRGLASGELLGAEPRKTGTVTFAQWLSSSER
ncbi:SDR family oxidoreductase [Timonella sp. A28]|uniref:SDR family oxidoreductase n=1 Tax=Timonella sp. A28 TaxID=3442640 RepID=UPI003EB6BF8D